MHIRGTAQAVLIAALSAVSIPANAADEYKIGMLTSMSISMLVPLQLGSSLDRLAAPVISSFSSRKYEPTHDWRLSGLLPSVGRLDNSGCFYIRLR